MVNNSCSGGCYVCDGVWCTECISSGRTKSIMGKMRATVVINTVLLRGVIRICGQCNRQMNSSDLGPMRRNTVCLMCDPFAVG